MIYSGWNEIFLLKCIESEQRTIWVDQSLDFKSFHSIYSSFKENI